VVVGAGTIGGWASVFAREAGLGRVVVVERGLAGMGASSRAAGIVRAQGGTPATVALGRWSIDFYNNQQHAYGTDSGFHELGYLILAVTEDDERAGRERVAMQRANGLDVTWLEATAAAATAVTLAPDGHRGGSYVATDGAIDPPRNVRAYSLAMQAAGVELRERTTFTGLRTTAGRGGGARVVAVETDRGTIETDRVLLTGGPGLRAVGRAAGLRIPAGAARHTVAVLEPHPVFDLPRMPMVFDIGAGLYWRLEEGGLLFGWSDPDEKPGEARVVDWTAYDRARSRLAAFVPITRELGLRRIWAATIDYTPDHLPIIGPALTPEGGRIEGVTIASAGGHGMMWGPGVARVAADLIVDGRTTLTDVSDLGLDRFDEQGRSRLASDPIALPFPVSAE
jgi:sarcosine oxidase subunit beta